MWGWWTRMWFRNHIADVPKVNHEDELAAAREARRRAEEKRQEFDEIGRALAEQRRTNHFAARMAASFRSKRT